MKIIKSSLENLNGVYKNLKLTGSELSLLRGLIKEEYLERIKVIYPSKVSEFNSAPMNLYHKQSNLIDHKELWPKKERCLSEQNVSIIKNFDFMKVLKETFGSFKITDEDEIGREEVYWRLVRPNCNEDVGPLHADSWFWELSEAKEKKFTRYKVWIPIFCEENDSGFMYVSESHKKDWQYESVIRDGKSKPIPKINEKDIEITKFQGSPGNIIVFNDKLIHGGYSTSITTRVSLEFTLYIN